LTAAATGAPDTFTSAGPPATASATEFGLLGRTAAALLSTAPMIGALAARPRAALLGDPPDAPSAPPCLQVVMDRLAAGLAVPGVDVVSSAEGLTATELVISGHLRLADLIDDGPALAALADSAFQAIVAAARAAAPAATLLESDDGTVLRCYAAGPASAPAVVIVSACGMPVGLVAGWMAILSRSFRVLTWESRGLFDDDAAFDDRPYGVSAQAGDVGVVLDGFGVERAHLMGLCGGAPIALAAAALARVESLSLWHGDYELAGRAPKTRHQQDVQAMLTIAARGRVQAASLCRLFERPATLAKLRSDLAHHIFYPYANPELLYRYGRLNGAIMTTDCGPALASAPQPTLVVTCMEDTTAHPQGSVYVAEQLARGRLAVVAGGDHLGAFDAGPELVDLACHFIGETIGGAGR
jgi:3-oxoadipate enol-lactonase